jgi:hypothetical protein
MGSREKGGNIMGAICSFLSLCKQSANITEKQEQYSLSVPAYLRRKKSPVDPSQKKPMGPEETVRYFINPTGNLLRFAANQGFKTMPKV